MAEIFRPRTPEDVAEAVRWALGARTGLAVDGRGTKHDFGRPVESEHRIDLSEYAGIGNYDPGELVMNAAPATPVAAIRSAAAAHHQDLAFDPPDLGPLLGVETEDSIGGAFACNLSGSRRILAGAARDHILGVQGVNGLGEIFKSGGRMFKNVTGIDLCRLMTGSFGTLAVLTDLTFKVLPAPEQARTVLVADLDPKAAVKALSGALGSPYEVSGAAYLPASVACDSAVAGVQERAVTAVRVEGVGPSVEYRSGMLTEQLAAFGATAVLDDADSRTLWGEIRDVTFFVADRSAVVWRVSVTPGSGGMLLDSVLGTLGGRGYLDWGGGLVWLALDAGTDAHHAVLRDAVAKAGGGHATLVRADAAIRASIPVFQPQPAPLAAVSARVKASFDPNRVLNPGRMVAGV